jgi:hypothetical protein
LTPTRLPTIKSGADLALSGGGIAELATPLDRS